MVTEIKCRVISKGVAEGEVLLSKQGLSFYGSIDPNNGVVTEKGSDIEGQSVAGRILIFPQGKGSTVGSYTLYRLKKNGVAPSAIVNQDCETICAVGGIISGIPVVDKPERDVFSLLKNGQRIRVDAVKGAIIF